MVGIKLNNTIVVDSVKERDNLVSRFKGSNENTKLYKNISSQKSMINETYTKFKNIKIEFNDRK